MATKRSFPGFFITIEGVDGVGKTTQATLLTEHLIKNTKTPVFKLREPGGTSICEDIRNILKQGSHLAPICELFLFNAARNQLIEKVIRPAMELGQIVICDRFVDSTVAYQHYGNGIPLETVNAVLEVAVAEMLPNLTLLLELDDKEADTRAKLQNANLPFKESALKDSVRDGITKYDAASIEYKNQVARGFVYQAAQNPSRIVTIDATGTPEEVLEKIIKVVEPKLRTLDLIVPICQPTPST
jgi:dTMP kinase